MIPSASNFKGRAYNYRVTCLNCMYSSTLEKLVVRQNKYFEFGYPAAKLTDCKFLPNQVLQE